MHSLKVINKEEVTDDVAKILNEISAITFKDFKKNSKIFDDYLKSQNETIKKAAQNIGHPNYTKRA